MEEGEEEVVSSIPGGAGSPASEVMRGLEKKVDANIPQSRFLYSVKF